MSQTGAHPGSVASGTGNSSSMTTEKYPASTANESYPEVAPQMTQPALRTAYVPPREAGYSTMTPQTPYQYQDPTAKQHMYEPQEQQKRNPWGLSPLAFGVMVALITALVVGGAVGGGVAGAMSGNKGSGSDVPLQTVTVTANGAVTTGSGSVTSTMTVTSSGLPEPSSLKEFTVPEPYYVDTLKDPGCQQSTIDVQYGESYDLRCGVDIGSGQADDSDDTKVVADVVGLFAYSITDCLYACANVNHFTEVWKQDVTGGVMQQCRGVTWNYNMASANSSDHANCWLKNGTSNGFQCNSCISGIIQT